MEITEAAQAQIQLIQQNDYTLSGMSFRIKIGGKGCGGFTYETGFSEVRADDIKLQAQGATILMDPFTAFYTQKLKLDYQLNLKSMMRVLLSKISLVIAIRVNSLKTLQWFQLRRNDERG